MIRKSLLVGMLLLFTFCKNIDTTDKKIIKEEKNINDTLRNKKIENVQDDFNDELETSEELVSDIYFKSWRGN